MVEKNTIKNFNRQIYVFRVVESAIMRLASLPGSRQQRLSKISAEFVRLGDEYINELPTGCKKIMLSICKTFNDIKEDYEEKYSEDYRRNFGIKPEDLSGIKGINSIEFIHYTKADKIIQEIKKLYSFLHSELFLFNN